MIKGALAELNIKSKDQSIWKKIRHTYTNIPMVGTRNKTQIMQTPRFELGKRPGYKLKHRGKIPTKIKVEKKNLKKEEIEEMKNLTDIRHEKWIEDELQEMRNYTKNMSDQIKAANKRRK